MYNQVGRFDRDDDDRFDTHPFKQRIADRQPFRHNVVNRHDAYDRPQHFDRHQRRPFGGFGGLAGFGGIRSLGMVDNILDSGFFDNRADNFCGPCRGCDFYQEPASQYHEPRRVVYHKKPEKKISPHPKVYTPTKSKYCK